MRADRIRLRLRGAASRAARVAVTGLLIASPAACGPHRSPAAGPGSHPVFAPPRVEAQLPAADTGRASVDSLRRAGARDGRDRAAHRGVAGYFATGLVGGLTLGVFAPVAALTHEPVSIGMTTLGAAVVAGTVAAADNNPTTPPPALDTALLRRPPAYEAAFRAAYDRRLSDRRRVAGVVGSGVGVFTGLGFLAWLLFSHLGDS